MRKFVRSGGRPRRSGAAAQSPDGEGDDGGRRPDRGGVGGSVGGGPLSPAAASALAGDGEEEGDPRRGSPSSSPPLLLEASPPSSAPSSPKPSPASAVSSAASSEGEPPFPRAKDEARRVDDAGRGDDDDDDPYADVRPRLEDLSRRDRRRLLAASTSESPTARVDHPDITVFAAITTYLGYVVLIVVGHARDKFANAFRRGRYFRSEGGPSERGGEGETKPGGNGEDVDGRRFPSDDLARYAPLLKSWENFYTRRLYHRIQDCFNRPLASRPGARVAVLERVSYDGNKTMSVLGPLGGLDDRRRAAEYEAGAHYGSTADGRAVRKCLNLGSYNYLGFADDWDVTCRRDVLKSLRALPPSGGSCRSEFGTAALHREVERTVARFVGKDDALALNMGFNTNATVVPALVGPGDLIVSDELNHTSIVNGARASGASIRTFRHNDASDLAAVLRESVVHGRPRTRRPWGKVLVVVEGIYSMEGEICDLRGVVRACKRYGAYVYLDEAHSIGALGRTGRGCCERCGVDPADVDVMMGTFTKSFGGMGGYVAADRGVIATLRRECAGSSYHNALSPAVCQQIVSSFRVIMGEDGTSIGRRKLDALRDNSNYFRMRLADMGLHVLGDYDSPVVPIMLYNPTKIAAFSRECLKRGLAVVVVGFPAVPILMSRARFCVSAGHTRADLDRVLVELEEISDLLKLRYASSTFG